MLMGHSTLDMTRHYVNLYGADLSKDFERLNPLDNIKKARIPAIAVLNKKDTIKKEEDAVVLNMQDADDFDELSLNSYDIAIITFKDIQTSILAALVCKEKNIPMVI